MDTIKKLRKEGLLLKEIPKKEQTVEMCRDAIKQNPLALQFASRKCLDAKICLKAVEKNGWALQYVPKKLITEQMCDLAVEEIPELLKYVPEEFRTLEMCLNAVKKDVSVLSYISREKGYELFDDNTEIDLIEQIAACNPKWLAYMPNRSDVRLLWIKYMEEDFSIAWYMSGQVKASKDILDYQKSKGKLSINQKYYDSAEEKFKVKIRVVYDIYPSRGDVNKIISDAYFVIKEFEKFDDFYNYLEGNLFDAELRNYDFAGVNLKNYNIEGAVIKNDILQSQGLYDDTYFEAVKKHVAYNADETVANNEIVISKEFCYLSPVEDDGHKIYEADQIAFFYISDIHLAHRVCNEFGDRASKEEIRSYIKELTGKMVNSIGSKPVNSYLMIAGDTSSIFELSEIFYNELIQYWPHDRIIVVSGNHELWDPWAAMDENIEEYRNFFKNIGITFLQNELLYVKIQEKYGVIYQEKCGVIHEKELLDMSETEIKERVSDCAVIVLGGIGFSGLNEYYNASRIRYGKSFDELPREEALQKDMQEASRFDAVYKKVLSSLYKKRVIVLTHTKKENWNIEQHNPYWIYLNGHDHRNFCEVSTKRKIYADNQIGYRAKNIGLKYFYCDNDYDIFSEYQDGIYEITKEQYIDFNRGKLISMSFNGRGDGTIYMLKKDNVYMFMIYCLHSKQSKYKSLYLMDGARPIKLNRDELKDLPYYYENIERYVENINQLLDSYRKKEHKISEFVKSIGGSGKIHGCIVDVDKPNRLFGFKKVSYCHLFVNPIDGKVTPYFAYDKEGRFVYKDFKALLQTSLSCKEMLDNYLQLEEKSSESLSVIQNTMEVMEWESNSSAYDEGGYIYKISKTMSSFQYCMSKNIIRIWNEELLNYNFENRINQTGESKWIVEENSI